LPNDWSTDELTCDENVNGVKTDTVHVQLIFHSSNKQRTHKHGLDVARGEGAGGNYPPP